MRSRLCGYGVYPRSGHRPQIAPLPLTKKAAAIARKAHESRDGRSERLLAPAMQARHGSGEAPAGGRAEKQRPMPEATSTPAVLVAVSFPLRILEQQPGRLLHPPWIQLGHQSPRSFRLP